jgi:hypothetical protein
MNQPNPMRRQPVQGVGQGSDGKNTLVTLKIKEKYFVSTSVFLTNCQPAVDNGGRNVIHSLWQKPIRYE